MRSQWHCGTAAHHRCLWLTATAARAGANFLNQVGFAVRAQQGSRGPTPRRGSLFLSLSAYLMESLTILLGRNAVKTSGTRLSVAEGHTGV